MHIATHGMFRRDNPMFSSIRLGDGPLSVYDLYELRLSAELVTLSGCGTGLSGVVGGDEQLGLVRGLLYAGARGVLLTLWDAYDSSTADFMKALLRAHCRRAGARHGRRKKRCGRYGAPTSSVLLGALYPARRRAPKPPECVTASACTTKRLRGAIEARQ